MKLHALLAASLLALASTASADLARVGPNDVPAPPGNGFPKWYQDLTGLVLDLCMPNASDAGALQQTACLLGPPNPPYVFPSNFPDEAFYFRAVSAPLVTDAATGKRAVLVLALEAAFANGAPAAGDQMVFTRIRVTAGVPRPGTYRVIHPYGTETFEVTTVGAGNRDIVFTEDVGIAPGAFTQALSSRVGPFLTRDVVEPAARFVTINGAQFLSDGVTEELVTGSPFGTNYFEICGPFNAPDIESCLRADRFTLTGRVHDSVAQPIGSPLAIERATYARDAANSTRVNVVASVVAGTTPLLSAGAPGLPPVLLRGPDVLGRYYGQALMPIATPLPSLLTVINSSDTPPSTTTRHIVDEVRILSATYDPSSQELVVVATSSDKGSGDESAPILALEGFPGATVVRPSPATNTDPASAEFTVQNVLVAPTDVGVVSSAGGQDRRLTAVPEVPAFPAGVPLALDDAASTTASGAPVIIAVLNNDVSGSAPRFNPGAVSLVAPELTPSTFGQLLANSDGTVTFTPNATTGTGTFRYTVANSAGRSNPATVTITVTPGAGGAVPIANNDPATGSISVVQGQLVVIDVLANDSGNGGTLDPASVAVTTPPTRGTVAVNPTTGAVTYTAGSQAGSDSFQYTVQNAGTPANTSAPATVSISVVAPESITVTRARCQSSSKWDVRGTTSTNSSSVTLYLTATAPSLPQPSDILGTAPVDATGAFQFQLSGGPSCRTPISVRSSLGTVQNNVTVTLR